MLDGDDRVGCVGARASPSAPPIHHVLRNHSVGSRCTVAASRPRLATVMRTRDVVGIALGVLDVDVDVAVVVEHAGVEQLVLEVGPATRSRFVATRSSYG